MHAQTTEATLTQASSCIINIDASLIFDIDSLLFCVARKHVANERIDRSKDFKASVVYGEIVNRPTNQALDVICEQLALDSTVK